MGQDRGWEPQTRQRPETPATNKPDSHDHRRIASSAPPPASIVPTSYAEEGQLELSWRFTARCTDGRIVLQCTSHCTWPTAVTQRGKHPCTPSQQRKHPVALKWTTMPTPWVALGCVEQRTRPPHATQLRVQAPIGHHTIHVWVGHPPKSLLPSPPTGLWPLPRPPPISWVCPVPLSMPLPQPLPRQGPPVTQHLHKLHCNLWGFSAGGS